MNKRYLNCGKLVFAIGQENSIADYKNKLLTCFDCYKFIDCKKSQEYLTGIKKNQNILIKYIKGL